MEVLKRRWASDSEAPESGGMRRMRRATASARVTASAPVGAGPGIGPRRVLTGDASMVATATGYSVGRAGRRGVSELHVSGLAPWFGDQKIMVFHVMR